MEKNIDRLSASDNDPMICMEANRLILSHLFDYFPSFESEVGNPVEHFGNGINELLRPNPAVIIGFDYIKSVSKTRFIENKKNLVKNLWLGNLQKDTLELTIELRGKDELYVDFESLNPSHISFSDGLTAYFYDDTWIIKNRDPESYFVIGNFGIGKQVTIIPDLKNAIDFDVVIHIKRTE